MLAVADKGCFNVITNIVARKTDIRTAVYQNVFDDLVVIAFVYHKGLKIYLPVFSCRAQKYVSQYVGHGAKTENVRKSETYLAAARIGHLAQCIAPTLKLRKGLFDIWQKLQTVACH